MVVKFNNIFMCFSEGGFGLESMKSINRVCMKLRWIFQLVIICFIIGLFILMFNYNNIVLIKFSSQLFELDLPENIYVMEKCKLRGKLNGNGNGMDFFACILVKTGCSQKELYNYLNGQEFTPAKNHELVETEVIKLQSNRLETRYVEHGEIVFETIKNEADFDDYYVLIIYDGGYSADFDILGH